MSTNTPNTIELVSDFLAHIKKLNIDNTYIFRGVSNEDYGVKSTAQRRLKKSGSTQTTLKYCIELIQKYKSEKFKDKQELSDLEILAELQHYGAATFLIDFTFNALVALWFACQKSKDAEAKDGEAKDAEAKDGVVFCFQYISSSNNISAIEYERVKKNIINNETLYDIFIKIDSSNAKDQNNELKESKPIANNVAQNHCFYWEPKGSVKRAFSQQSIFLFTENENIFQDENNKEYVIQKISVPNDNKDKILKELEILGVTDEFLFPDFEGFVKRNSVDILLKDDANTDTSANDFLIKGIKNYQEGKYNEAIQDYTKAIELDPTFVIAYNNRGNTYYELKDYENAIQDYTKAIELDPNNANWYFNRGNTYQKQEKYNEAIQDYNKAIELNPNYDAAYNNRGNTYYELKDYENAIQDYTKAIELNPNNANAYFNRGHTYYRLKYYKNAIQDYTKAIQLNINNLEVYNNRGNTYSRLKDYKNAIQDYNKAIELNSNYHEAYNNRGNTYCELKDYKNAIQDYNKAIELNSNYHEAYNNRGNTYCELKDYKNAIQDYTKAIELNSNYYAAYNNRGSTYRIKRLQKRYTRL